MSFTWFLGTRCKENLFLPERTSWNLLWIGMVTLREGGESHGKCRKVAENYGSGLACARPEERF